MSHMLLPCENVICAYNIFTSDCLFSHVNKMFYMWKTIMLRASWTFSQVTVFFHTRKQNVMSHEIKLFFLVQMWIPYFHTFQIQPSIFTCKLDLAYSTNKSCEVCFFTFEFQISYQISHIFTGENLFLFYVEEMWHKQIQSQLWWGKPYCVFFVEILQNWKKTTMDIFSR